MQSLKYLLGYFHNVLAQNKVKYLFNTIKNQHCNYIRPILFPKDEYMLYLSLSQKNLMKKVLKDYVKSLVQCRIPC